ncbi:hypothetical protein AGLY_005000 [Aphis glycines]|uniref:Uncharacterized protein n=1 Tax=Aphis glycines TaxID=307491 RepID=A0A6G0TVH7_APHGL|nr:hypothetical protein AGLY_005000 [Aphis glycines]
MLIAENPYNINDMNIREFSLKHLKLKRYDPFSSIDLRQKYILCNVFYQYCVMFRNVKSNIKLIQIKYESSGVILEVQGGHLPSLLSNFKSSPMGRKLEMLGGSEGSTMLAVSMVIQAFIRSERGNNEQVKQLEEKGIVEHSDSPWNAPLLIDPKKLDAVDYYNLLTKVDYDKALTIFRLVYIKKTKYNYTSLDDVRPSESVCLILGNPIVKEIVAYALIIIQSFPIVRIVCMLVHFFCSYRIYFTMPKEKQSVSSRLKNIVREFGENTFATDASVLLCKFCNIKINHDI